jgi:hypothetical protein
MKKKIPLNLKPNERVVSLGLGPRTCLEFPCGFRVYSADTTKITVLIVKPSDQFVSITKYEPEYVEE